IQFSAGATSKLIHRVIALQSALKFQQYCNRRYYMIHVWSRQDSIWL
uniref:Uncharacterized protein n=1 Tax=Triticum urartu TaxID=4572 RepID=A0A8R7R7P2_TRIUA